MADTIDRNAEEMAEITLPVSLGEALDKLTILDIKCSKIMDEERYENIYSVEEVNRMVVQGVPFREAYRKVGESINNNTFHPEKTIHHTHEGSIGNLCLPQIREKMTGIIESFHFDRAEKAIEYLITGSK